MATLELSLRRKAVLDLIVSSYIRTASPISSLQLSRNKALNVSAATIRNDMAELEEMGFINRPHTSAGGVPVEPGYRFYVERHASTAKTDSSFEQLVDRALGIHGLDLDGLARVSADVLSSTNRNVAIVSTPNIRQDRLKQVQLIRLSQSTILLVVLLSSTQVIKHPLDVPEDINEDALQNFSNLLNRLMAGQTSTQMRATAKSLPTNDIPLEIAKSIAEEAALLVSNAVHGSVLHPHVEGLRHLLGQPEFMDPNRAREAVEVIENEDLLRSLTENNLGSKTVHLVIGRENQSEQLRSYSVLTTNYGRINGIKGVITLIGPMRMDYGQAFASLKHLAASLENLVSHLESQPR
ncbi:MAG: heat-inducible transcription repressor HrcA [Chloroflexi bacterium]|nr:heat-inducible transcription repressor HrcA [Chloroflexota bacterium]|tara:strand:+ start:74 stop:1129 length:1056 start_codon:yes stop_codon:yes gene_type:complete